MNIKSSCGLVLTALACTVVAHAQTGQTSGAARGIVKNKKTGPVADARVLLRNQESGLLRAGTTDAKGSYLISLLPSGLYDVTVTAPGLQPVKGHLRVNLGETAFQNFTLDPVEAAATVEVVAQVATIDTTNVNTNATITEEFVAAVPLQTRNFTELVQLTPGAPPNSQGYRTSVEGARGVMSNLMIDGTSFNSRFNGEQRGGTRIPFAFGLDSIKELQVITNPFDVQYGDASGGVVNAITKSGTNEFHGGAFTQFRPNWAVAKMKPVPYDSNGSTNSDSVRTRYTGTSEYGFNLGGPILKDKVHFFVNVDYVKFSQRNVPAVAFSKADGTDQSFADFWGPGGMGQGVKASNKGLTLNDERFQSWDNVERHLTVMTRLDWAINADHRATLRLNSQTYRGENDIYAGSFKTNIAESNNSQVTFNTLSWVAELNSVLTPSLLNEARIQVSTERRPETPNSTVSPEISVPGFTAGTYYIDPRNTDEMTLQLIDNLTWLHGDWTFKTGVDYQALTYKNTFFQYGRGSWQFKNWASANSWFAGAPSGTITYNQAWSNSNGYVEFGERLLASYLSANYAGLLDKRLNLTFGLRYTREMYDRNPNPNPKVQGLDQMPDSGSLDPRFGFAFDVFGNNRTLVRGGIGLFSSANPAQNVASTFLQNGQNTLPYRIAFGNATANLFTTGALSRQARLNGDGNLTILDPNTLKGLNVPAAVQVTLMDPRARMSRSRNLLLGVEQDLGDGYVVKARGVYKQFYGLQYFVDINMAQKNPANGAWDPSIIYNDGYPFVGYNHFNNASGSTTRPFRAIVDGRSLDLSGYGAVGLSRWNGEGSYKAVILEGERKSRSGFGFMGSITFSQSRDCNSNERGTAQSAASNPVDPSNPNAQALSDNHIPIRAVLVTYFPTFYGIRSSAHATLSKGYPWTPRYNADMNEDGYFNDPVPEFGGRNGLRQRYAKTLNLKFSRAFKLYQTVRLEGVLDIYNPLNWANQTTTQYVVDTSSGTPNPGFAQINSLDKKTRELQLTLKATF